MEDEIRIIDDYDGIFDFASEKCEEYREIWRDKNKNNYILEAKK